MIFSRKRAIAFLIIFSIISNIFISLHHFGHHGHAIDLKTGKLIHTHCCDEYKNGHGYENNSYLPSENEHERSDDTCFALDVVFKHSLQNSVSSSVIKVFKDFSYIPVYSELTTDLEDILSFAPKNSPPAA